MSESVGRATRGVGFGGRVGCRAGAVLPLVLLMLVLLGLLAASSSFYVHADLSATQSAVLRMQARLAAEAGIQKVMLFLRAERGNVDAWYHNPEAFHRIIVWSDQDDPEILGTNHEFREEELRQAFRFSIVADNPDDDEKLVRYGVTDESGKLNINTATRDQLVRLIGRFATEEMNVDELVDALLDWRDADSNPRQFGVEDQYYAQLDPPYKVKNAPFDTVEELLLVRGFSGELLYGEDYDRNGLMSPNENDGDERFPPDNGDDALNPGLYPYITVYSRDTNTTAENKPRVYLFGNSSVVQSQLAQYVEDQAKLNFIAQAGTGSSRIASPAELLRDRESQVGRGAGGRGGRGGSGAGGGDTARQIADLESQLAAARQAGDAEAAASYQQMIDSLRSGDGGAGAGSGAGPGGGAPGGAVGVRQSGGSSVPSPLTDEDMIWVMDVTTTSPSPELVGLININTASPVVLSTLPGLTEEDVAEIVAMRAEMPPEDKGSVGWLIRAIGREKFIEAAPYVSARGTRFRVDSIGYADHLGTMARIEAVLEMRGPVAQIVYMRDLTKLGTNFPVQWAEGDAELAGYDD